jgi:hypothetical protein
MLLNNPVYAPYVEHVPPDTTAAIFWLNTAIQLTGAMLGSSST